MTNHETAEKLLKENLINETSYQRIISRDTNKFLSLSFELKTMLYAGVLLLASGLGIIIYKNIDTIGHLTIIFLIATVSFISFRYCSTKRLPYSNEKVPSPNIFFDYVLLLACLTCISFVGYLQYQYSVFGSINALAFLIPAIICFAAAYLFDNIGVLSIAITSFAAFAGITIAPTSLLSGNALTDASTIYAGLGIGTTLVLAGNFLSERSIKEHFTFTYFNFAIHLLYIFCLSGLISLDSYFVFIPILVLLIAATWYYAIRENSFYFLLAAFIYGYIGITYLFFKLLYRYLTNYEVDFYLSMIYFILTGIYIIRYLKNKKQRA